MSDNDLPHRLPGDGRPGSRRWEIVTALFGWVAVFALLGWLIAKFAGLEDTAGWLSSLFGACFGVAFKRDLVKLLRTGRIER